MDSTVSTETPMVVRVVGMPTPKGSGRAMPGRGGGAVFVASGSKANEIGLKSWAGAVAEAISAMAGTKPRFPAGALIVGIVFRLPMRRGDLDKATGLPKPGAPLWSTVKPDVDKLTRATLDALTVAKAWTDDGQVAGVLAFKVYTLAEPGAWIVIHRVDGRGLLGVSGVVNMAVQELWRRVDEIRDAEDSLTAARAAAKAERKKPPVLTPAEIEAIDNMTFGGEP